MLRKVCDGHYIIERISIFLRKAGLMMKRKEINNQLFQQINC